MPPLSPELQNQIETEAEAYMHSALEMIDDIVPSHLKYAFEAGATTYALRAYRAEQGNERLKKVLSDIHHYCNQNGIYSAPLQQMIVEGFNTPQPTSRG